MKSVYVNDKVRVIPGNRNREEEKSLLEDKPCAKQLCHIIETNYECQYLKECIIYITQT